VPAMGGIERATKKAGLLHGRYALGSR
jgi:hypothetical protein